MQLFKPRENRRLMLEALVANELQRGVDLLPRLDAGERLRASTRPQVLPQELDERLQRQRYLSPARIIQKDCG